MEPSSIEELIDSHNHNVHHNRVLLALLSPQTDAASINRA